MAMFILSYHASKWRKIIVNFVFLGGQSNPVDRKFRVFCFWQTAALIEIASKILKKFYMIVERYVYRTQYKFHVKKIF